MYLLSFLALHHDHVEPLLHLFAALGVSGFRGSVKLPMGIALVCTRCNVPSHVLACMYRNIGVGS
jgi:hypothetical protein